ncbi:MAG: MerR family transcriptional regulator [Bacteroidales bacterium]|nr:MAG: MerR family transcriptional regulator [Bacteroidales bacterium]
MEPKSDSTLVKKTSPVYTLSIASGLSKIPIPSIRQYIDKGLIIPFKKDSKRHLFSDIDIIRLKYIRQQLEDQGLNIAGIKSLLALLPCWAIRSCSVSDREKCQAYKSITNPCWEASEKGLKCRNTNCRECSVYCILEENMDLKSLIRSFIK